MNAPALIVGSAVPSDQPTAYRISGFAEPSSARPIRNWCASEPFVTRKGIVGLFSLRLPGLDLPTGSFRHELSRSAEVAAQNGYVKAKVDLHRATGDILEENNVFLEEAYRGEVSRPHDPIPPPQPQP